MKYLGGLVATHKLLQLCKLMVKTSGLEITFNELLAMAAIGDDKKEVREISREIMIDKATVVRTLGKLRENRMVSRVEIDTRVYYMLSNAAINFMDGIQRENNDILVKMKEDEREKLVSCVEGIKETSDFISKYLVED